MDKNFIMEYGTNLDNLILFANTFLGIKNSACKAKELEYSKLSKFEANIMLYFTKNETYCMGDLARLTSVSEKAINMYIKNLLKLGYISKFQDTTDKRIYHTTITQKGMEIMNEYRDYANDVMYEIINKKLTDEEQIKLNELTIELSELFKKFS